MAGKRPGKRGESLGFCIMVRTWGGSEGRKMKIIMEEYDNVLECCLPRNCSPSGEEGVRPNTPLAWLGGSGKRALLSSAHLDEAKV